MMKNVHIRRLAETDQAAHSALWRDALIEQDECFRISIDDESLVQIQTTFSEESFTLGAFIDSTLIGTVSVERDWRKKLRHKALLFRMYVHRSAAGQGIGKALLNEAVTAAQNIEGLQQMNLTVLANNVKAVHLYSAIGFKPFALELAAVRIGDAYLNEIQMAYFLR